MVFYNKIVNGKGDDVMIYVPMLKNRGEELRVVSNISECFSDKVVPLIEVITEKYKTTYKMDEKGEFIYEKRKNRKCKVKAIPTEQDIITLQYINQLVGQKKVFIDYFRFTLDKYGKNIDFSSAELSFNLNNSYDLYKKKVFSITEYTNMIPVISVKPGFDISKSELVDFLNQIQAKSRQVALRITEEWIGKYQDIIKNILREDDYLLFDIEEQNPKAKFMEIEEIQDYRAKCKMVLLNSPRKMSVKNGDYPEQGIADLIDNCAKDIANEYGLNGYGDYCGLKDTMPMISGSNGTGAALALLYDYNDNVFCSYCNHDTSLGMQGYRMIIPLVLADEPTLNRDDDCPGYEKIHGLQGNGNWNTWHHINAARYIHQVYKYI